MTIKYLKKANKTSSTDDQKTKEIVEKILKNLEKSKEDGCIKLTKKFDKLEKIFDKSDNFFDIFDKSQNVQNRRTNIREKSKNH